MILDKKILNISEVAYLLGISDRGVYQLIHSANFVPTRMKTTTPGTFLKKHCSITWLHA